MAEQSIDSYSAVQSFFVECPADDGLHSKRLMTSFSQYMPSKKSMILDRSTPRRLSDLHLTISFVSSLWRKSTISNSMYAVFISLIADWLCCCCYLLNFLLGKVSDRIATRNLRSTRDTNNDTSCFSSITFFSLNVDLSIALYKQSSIK